MSKNIIPIAGTPDSFLMLDVFPYPEAIMDYLNGLLTPEDHANKSKPTVSFYAEKDPKTNSLAYLRCPSIRRVEEYTPGLRGIAKTIDPSVNIIKVLRYDDGSKWLKSHADKTIDLDDKVPIYNVRLGAPRKFVLEHKTNGTVIPTVVPHNAMFILGLKTNAEFTHGVPEELDVKDPAYSIILRKSVTFKDIGSEILWGERTPFKTYDDLKEYVGKGGKVEDTKSELINLWGIENRCVVGEDHYTDYSSTTVSKSLIV